jgi:hypothetical protein
MVASAVSPTVRAAVMRLHLLPLLLWLIGCGDTTGPSHPAPAGRGGASASGASGHASGGQSAGQGGSGIGGSAGSAAAGDGGVGVGGGAPEDEPLLPLVRGRRSWFAFSPIDATKPMTGTCDNPTTSIESDEGLSLDGHTGMLYLTFCAADPFLIEGAGDDLTAYEVKNGALVLPAFAYIHSPVQTGETWESGRGDRYTWQQARVPLVTAVGTFEQCWQRHGTDTVITYCRGVGLVRASASYGNYQLELIEKNF